MTATRRQLERDLIHMPPLPPRRRDEALRRYYDATPHPDRLIEASRPRPEDDDNRAHVMLGWLMLVLCVISVALLGMTLWLATVSRVETELRITPEMAVAMIEGQRR